LHPGRAFLRGCKWRMHALQSDSLGSGEGKGGTLQRAARM